MKFNRKKLIEPAILLLVFLLVMGLGQPAIRDAPFHPDEAHKIAETYFYYLLFVKHDPASADWQFDFYARTNPPAAKYILGAWMSLRGRQVRDLSLQQQFERLWRNPAELQRCVPGPLLSSGRTVSLFFGALTLLMVYLIGRLSGSIWAGILGALLLACHPSFRYHSTVALYDGILIFFMSAVVPATLLVLKHSFSETSMAHADASASRQRRAGTCWAVIAAVIIAAAAGTKLHGALAALFFLTAVPAGFLFCRPACARRPGQSSFVKVTALTAGPVFLALFIAVAMNPSLYDAPFRKIPELLSVYADWTLKQMIDPGQPLWTVMQKISAAGVFNFLQPQSFFFKSSVPFLFMIFFIGMVSLVWRLTEAAAQRRFPPGEAVVLTWTAVYSSGVIGWVPLAWDRYFLTLAPCIALVSGYGLAHTAAEIIQSAKAGSPVKGYCRAATVMVLSVIVSLALWYGAMDRTILPPGLLLSGGQSSETVLRRYERANAQKPGDPLRMLYTADMKVLSGNPAGACPLYEAGISRLEAGRSRRTAGRVMAAYGRFALAGAYYQLSRYDEAAASLEAHIGGLKSITRTLRSCDPKVAQGFESLIGERERLLAAILRKKS